MSLIYIFEGVDGSGKTTIINYLTKHYSKKNYKIGVFKNPGTTELGNIIRKLVFEKVFDINTEFLLFLTSIHNNNIELINTMNDYDIIFIDRWYYSLVAYQCYGNNFDLSVAVKLIDYLTTQLVIPITKLFFLDIDEDMISKRLKNRKDTFVENKLEKNNEFFKNVINGYRRIFSYNTNWITKIDAMKNKNEVINDIIQIINKDLNI